MENATKAMLMAAGVLIGLMVISLGISLYVSLSDYVESTQNEIAMTEIKEFNKQFTQYINYNAMSNTVEYALTIQDIVTAANMAYENNLKTDYYVTVKLDGVVLEKTITSETSKLLQNGLGKEYKCDSTDIKISEKTGRVCEIKFTTL